MANYRCVCGKIIPRRWEICTGCRKKYGNRDVWPAWVKYLVSNNEKEYYYETVIEPRLISFDEEFDDEEDEELKVPNDPLITRNKDELYFDSNLALPYAPYNNDKDNRAYRRANNIPELK